MMRGMSDEQQKTPPISLRLKPRASPPPVEPVETPPPLSPAQMPSAAEPPPPIAPELPQAAPPALPSAPGGESLKFRLKPKSPPPESPAAETPLPFSNPPHAVEPPVSTPAESMVPPPLPIASAMPAVPPAFRPAASPGVPPLLTGTPPAAMPPPLSPPIPPHIPAPRSFAEPPVLPTSEPPERAIKADKWLAAIVVLVVVIAGAGWGARLLFKAHPKPQATDNAPPSTSADGQAKPVPGGQTKLVDNPQSAAGKAVARARDTVAAIEQRERTQGVSSVLDDAATPAPEVVREIPPSDAFRQFVTNLRVNGVFQGENPRAMLNGKMYSLGMEVDARLAIRLHKVDPEAKQLIFIDDTGAIFSRRY